jgi:lactate permease
MWTQTFDPFQNLALSAAVAALPIVFLLWALVVRGLKGYVAGLATIALTLLIAVLVYGMPPHLALLAAIHGALYGLFPIGWIVLAAVVLYQITVRTGQFDVIKQSVASLTEDRRIQALLIAFSFGAFLEGCAGFGAPVAISAGMLVGLGFDPRYAAGLCLVANTAPVAFGSIGIPLITASQVTGLDLHALSQMVGRQLPLLSLIVPFYLVALMAGRRGIRAVWPAALVSGGSFAAAQFLTSNLLGPMLPDIISSVVSILALVLLLRVWQPADTFRFAHEGPPVARTSPPPLSATLRAWSPFLVLTLVVGDWGVRSVQAVVDLVSVRIPVPWLHQAIVNPETGAALPAVFRFNWLGASGTSVFIAAVLSAVILRMPVRAFAEVCRGAARQLAWSLVTIAAFLGFAFVGSASGITTTLGWSLAATGPLFAFFSPVLGWLGVFITGSDTSANALFGRLQQVSASRLDLSPILTVASNSSGGVTGKMISPQSITVACAASGLVGREPELLRFTLPHSIAMVTFVGAVAWSQATWLSWMVPVPSPANVTGAATTAASQGVWVLAASAIVVAIIAFSVRRPKLGQQYT